MRLSVRFKEFGVGLAFTPIVMSEGRISLKIETEVSELTNDWRRELVEHPIPALKKRQAKSTVELPSGGSIALAGLMSNDTRQNIDGMPGLKDLPVLGTLFRSRDFMKERNGTGRNRDALPGPPGRPQQAGPSERRVGRSHGHESELPRSPEPHLRKRRPSTLGQHQRRRLHRRITPRLETDR